MTVPSENDQFQKLVDDLNAVLGPSSGINDDDVDVQDLIRLLEQYTSREHEWNKYALADPSRSYTRNLVDEGNGKSNLLVLVWNPGKASLIHDHGSHCIMKVLKGQLKETLYDWPDQEKAKAGIITPLVEKRTKVYKEGQVTYMSDKLGIHSVGNPEQNGTAVSLHLYTPPRTDIDGCHIFQAETGIQKLSKGLIYSKFGHRI